MFFFVICMEYQILLILWQLMSEFHIKKVERFCLVAKKKTPKTDHIETDWIATKLKIAKHESALENYFNKSSTNLLKRGFIGSKSICENVLHYAFDVCLCVYVSKTILRYCTSNSSISCIFLSKKNVNKRHTTAEH